MNTEKHGLKLMQVYSDNCRIEPKCFGCIKMIAPAFGLSNN